VKSELTSFDVAAIVFELKHKVNNARIRKIYQTDSTTLIFKLHRPDEPPFHLLIESGKRINLTSYVLQKPSRPPAFCMALRKHLGNGRISDMQQLEFERTVTIKISKKEGEFQLIVELFGEGNIILVSPESKILQALVYKKMRDRNILRGERFQYAPSRAKNPFKTSRKDFDEIKNFGQLMIVKALTKLLSIGGLYAEEILLRAEINKNSPCEALGKPEFDRIFAQLQLILSSLTTGQIEPCLIVGEHGKSVDVTPIRLKRYEHLQTKSYGKFNEALDEFYMETTLKTGMAQATRKFERQLAKLQRVIDRQQKALENSKVNITRNKKLGQLISTHLGEFQLLQQRIMNEKENGKSWKQIISDLQNEKGLIPTRYFQALDSKHRILTVSLKGSTIQIDLTRSIQVNAAKFYERAKKAQRKLEGAQIALRETCAKIEELQQRKQKIMKEPKLPPVKREKAWYEKFRWFQSSDDLLVIGGKDATTNEILIKKHMEPHDIVFHADITGAPFVIIKTEGKQPSEQSLKEAAQLAASYSRAWKETLGAVGVYWVHPKQISKSPPSGQYLKKGSFIIRGTKNYIRNVPLAVAIGVQIEDHARIIGGSPEAIRKHASVYVEIVAGEHKSSELAKKIRRILAEKVPADWRKQILETPLEEIQTFIPSGKGDIKSA
jgi:predicted ribosome quality control (RQC) complex YloA/Tae2 family protein